jgi:oligoendopeptidase F
MLTPWWHNYRIFFMPFYAIEYAIPQLGTVQLWQKSRQNRVEALKRYRTALALGNTKSLPELYQAAGVSLAFDEATLQTAVDAIEMEILALEA